MKRLILLAVLLTTALGTRPARAAKYAVLVGVDNYENEDISDLQFAVTDVKAVGAALQRDLKFDDVRILTSDQPRNGNLYPTADNVLVQLDLLANVCAPDDTFVFYFSGHGFQRSEGHFLATADANPFNLITLKKSTVSLADLREAMARIKAQQVVFILDACRNDPEKGKGAGDNKMTAGFARDLQTVATQAGAGQAATALLMACSQGERAWEWPEQKHGVFTYYLLQGLGGRAREADGDVTAYSLGKYVQTSVQAWCKANRPRNQWQTPDFQLTGAAELRLGHPVGSTPAVNPQPAPVPVPDPVVLGTSGKLKVESTPAGASVYVDGEKQGVTPLEIELDLGFAKSKAVEVGVELNGYKRELLAVTLSRGSSTPLSLGLEKLPQPVGPQLGQVKVNPKDGAEMIFIPAGEFIMGSNDGNDNEKPQHTVYLDGYWIYKTEVTVGQYRKFCAAMGHKMPKAPKWGWNETHPVVNVSWDDAKAYCDWAGVSLPTEAQWEKAARGTDGRKYPWGNEWDMSKLQLSHRKIEDAGGTSSVGSFLAGASPYGALDMEGNVWEWCNDWYGETYYQGAPTRNPSGPVSGQDRVLRGGSWVAVSPGDFRVPFRVRNTPSDRYVGYGFRCSAGL
jgi:formylglycine-generating enzyme required for sulfatase activity/uncharacterized caspase-like protein